jgi:type II secretory pathway component GspD/PulD (secretin)
MIHHAVRPVLATILATILAALMCVAVPAHAQAPDPAFGKPGEPVSMSFRDASLHEVFDLLSRRERINILLGKGVTGTVSVSLYNVDVRKAIHTIAEAAGYAVEVRNGDYLILDRKESGLDTANGNTQIRSFKVQYSNPKQVAEILTKHLSRYGKITPLVERNQLVVEDLPDFLQRLQRLLAEIDVEPKQIMIEAKILEIALDNSEVFGIDWSKIFSANGVSRGGTTGLAPRNVPGLFFNLVNKNLEVFLSALSNKGRVHTLSTPKLLALENQEASTVIGDRVGYKVTTTINQVTTESIQFLETGVILKVTPSVDQQGRVMLRIHPEVSSASIAAGIPSKKSTEVTTQLLCEDGESIFIGGLIKNTTGKRRTGVPLLGDLPGVGYLFSSNEEAAGTTETVVVITPHIIRQASDTISASQLQRLDVAAQPATQNSLTLERTLSWPVAEPASSN